MTTDDRGTLHAYGFAPSVAGLWLTPDGLRLVSQADALQLVKDGNVPTMVQTRITATEAPQ